MSEREIPVPEPIAIGANVPRDVRIAIEFAMWQAKRLGFTFRNGETATYWRLLGVVASHLERGEEAKP